MDLFSFDKARIKLNKKEPIRLFETFSGYGSQAMALKRLGLEVNSVGISDWWTPAIIAYGEVHGNPSKELKAKIKTLEKDEIIDLLLPFKLSFNDKNIATRQNYERKNIKELRRILYYNTISKNYGNIENVKGYDVVDVDVFTFSFPCQDLSKAGQQKGISEETRSGLVYEVLRILAEIKGGGGTMPTVLLMENVPDLLSQKFKDGWHEIYNEIESLGYTNHAFFLNAKDFEVAQNRERVFMVSVYGDYAYDIPQAKPLVKRLKDYLEDEVDERYYLSDKMLQGMLKTKFSQYKLENQLKDKEGIAATIMARFEGAPQVIQDDEIINPLKDQTKYGWHFEQEVYDDKGITRTIKAGGGSGNIPKVIAIPEATKKGYALAEDGDGVYINRPHQKRGVVQKDMIQTLKTSGSDVGVVVEDKRNLKEKLADELIESEELKVRSVLRIRKLTPREVLRLMDVSEDDIDSILKVSSNTVAYKLAGNSIVVNVLVEIFKKLF